MMAFKASYFLATLASDSKVRTVERIASLRAPEVSSSVFNGSYSKRAACAVAISSSSGMRRRLKSSKLIAELR